MYQKNDLCNRCGKKLKQKEHPPWWSPKPLQKYWYKVWYTCPTGHVFTNEVDKVYPGGVKIEFEPRQITLIKSDPIPKHHPSKRRKCWICKRRFLSTGGDELCDECIEKFGEQKIKAEPKAAFTKTALTAKERAVRNSGNRPWLEKLRKAHKQNDPVEKHCQSRAIRKQMERY